MKTAIFLCILAFLMGVFTYKYINNTINAMAQENRMSRLEDLQPAQKTQTYQLTIDGCNLQCGASPQVVGENR